MGLHGVLLEPEPNTRDGAKPVMELATLLLRELYLPRDPPQGTYAGASCSCGHSVDGRKWRGIAAAR